MYFPQLVQWFISYMIENYEWKAGTLGTLEIQLLRDRHLSGIHIGTQGWNYDDWVGPFYPRGARASEYLDLYARIYDTVEVDSTFYAIPSENSIRSWRDRAPAGFSYSLKLPQQITHEQRLSDCGDLLKQFCERASGLGEKLAIVLIQLPPDFSPRAWEALEKFLPLLSAEMRFAVEFRDRSWFGEVCGDRVLELLARSRVAAASCHEFKKLIGQSVIETESLVVQPSLF